MNSNLLNQYGLKPLMNNLPAEIIVKFKLKPLTWALTVGLAAALSNGACAAETSVSNVKTQEELVFVIKSVNVLGRPGMLSERTQEKLQQVLNGANGPQRGVDHLRAIIQQGQKILDVVHPGAFVLSLPPQTLAEDGKVSVLVSPVLVKQPEILSFAGYDESTILASLPPTFQAGSVLSGRELFDSKSLTMLGEHPLKDTKVKFAIEPDKPVSATITVTPLAKSSVTVDSFGNDVIGRGMLTLTHSLGNVGVPNDVLSFYGVTSMSTPFQVGLGSLRYTLFNSASVSSQTLGILHSASHVDTPYLSFGNIAGKGEYTEVNYRYARYLDWTGFGGLKVTKVFGDVALANSKANTQYLSSVLTDYTITTLPLSVGAEGFWTRQKLVPSVLSDAVASMRVQTVFNKSGMLGTSAVPQLDKARSGAGSSAVLRWSVDGNATLLNHARLNMQFIGQYTGSKLVPSGQMAVAGDRVGVRGFLNAVLMGDSVAVLRTELGPKLSSNLGLNIWSRPYVFYDTGYKHGGNDQRNLSVASTGLGWRWTPLQGDSHGLLFDVYAAHKLQGASLDLQPGTTARVSKTTLWATGTYRF